MTIDRDALRRFLSGTREARVGLLAELVRMPSDNPPGDCAPHATRTAARLEALGLAVERHPVPPTTAAAAGMVSATNLVVRRSFGTGGPVIALNAHGDVVPPGEGWTSDPYGAAVVDGWMVGRGAAVSKSDIATYAFAILALAEQPAGLRGTVELHVTYDEEIGGTIGPALLLAEGIVRPDLAICAGFSYAVTVAHAGCLHLEATVLGRSAHAAMPATGIDALEAAHHVLAALYAERHRLRARISETAGIGAAQLTVGLISGGINTNVVPDRVTLRLDRRVLPEESCEAVEAGLRRTIEDAASRVPGARVALRTLLCAAPLVPQANGARLAQALARRASEVLGEPVGTTGVPLYTDARHYAAAGVPTVLYGAGPRTIEEANAHRANERLPLATLEHATEVVALALGDLLAWT